MESKFYRIRYTPLAFEDLDKIDDYISVTLANPQAALALLDEIERSVSRLKRYPFMGSKIDDVVLATKDYRKLVVGNYLIFHLVNEAEREIVIMRVIYGAREYRDLL